MLHNTQLKNKPTKHRTKQKQQIQKQTKTIKQNKGKHEPRHMHKTVSTYTIQRWPARESCHRRFRCERWSLEAAGRTGTLNLLVLTTTFERITLPWAVRLLQFFPLFNTNCLFTIFFSLFVLSCCCCCFCCCCCCLFVCLFFASHISLFTSTAGNNE